MTSLRDRERIQLETAAEWREWLQANHARPDGVWVVSWKASSGRRRLSYDETIEEALCFGWVDGQSSPLDAERSMLWFAPRRRGSPWARTNKERVERLEREGRMTEAGRAVIERARADGTWAVLDGSDALIVPDDLAAAFDRYPNSRGIWDAFPPSVRRGHLGWIALAKRPETRAGRVDRIAEAASRGQRANWPERD
jgi:uncharacterized protein YdeI (YjbR/CyaY-like superfamily)